MLPLPAAQVSVNAGPAVTPGKAPVFVTSTVAVAVQALAGSVTVTVYVPAAFTTALAVLPPETMPLPAQLYVAPAVPDVTLTIPLVVVQSSVKGLPAVASGGFVFIVTATVAVFVQPFAGSVTVTV